MAFGLEKQLPRLHTAAANCISSKTKSGAQITALLPDIKGSQPCFFICGLNIISLWSWAPRTGVGEAGRRGGTVLMCNNTQPTDVSWLKRQAGSEKHHWNKWLKCRKRIKMTQLHSITPSSLFGEAATCPFLCRPLEGKGRGRMTESERVASLRVRDLASRPLLVLLPAGSGTRYLTFCILFFSSRPIRPLFPSVYL